MTTKYSSPSVEAIQEDSEDDSKGESRARGDDSSNEYAYRHPRSSDTVMAPVKANTGRERERRKHKSSSGARHSKKSRTPVVKQSSGTSREDNEDRRTRQRRNVSYRGTSSTSSSEDEEEPMQDHRAVLEQARAKLTSPSMVSTFTSLTTSTNKSSGSSGSNSTVTQASVTKRSLEKRPETSEAPMSPAVPDAPDVFAFLDNDSTVSLSNENGEEEDAEPVIEWATSEHQYAPSLPQHPSPDQASSSSASSSFHGSDHFSEPAADVDTDQSTSPEQSVKDQTSDHEPEVHDTPTDAASVKIAAQMAAAQQRQNLHNQSTAQSFGTPNMPRGNAVYPYHPGSQLSPRYTQHVKQRSLPRAEKIPVTGYELLASRLSRSNTESEEEQRLTPIYRKFGALNHRLLLHLQDEISELEEHLHRLDNADTQSRRAGMGGAVVPASRRAAMAAGGDLQWHKTDTLGKIGFKLAQYNQALTAFNTTQSLSPPDPNDIETYREYLSTEHPIAESETHFLDPTDDLVSVCSERLPRPSVADFNTETQTSYSSSLSYENEDETVDYQPELPGLAIAIAVAVLIPILTFSVIPGFIGRLTVVGLVGGGVVGALMQAGLVNPGLPSREGLICAGMYGGVMTVIAGIMA